MDNRVSITFRIPQHIYVRLLNQSRETGVPMNRLVVQSLEKTLNKSPEDGRAKSTRGSAIRG